MAMILVTGASSGLGLATAASLTASGHAVVAHVRRAGNEPDVGADGHLHRTVFGDLSRHDDVMGLAEELNGLGRFDTVIHNAGVLDGPDVVDVNIVAPYLLTALMHPPGRAIYLSSSMHRSGHSRLDGLTRNARGQASYSDSKLYVTALALALARRSSVLSHAVDPGWVPTRMGGPSASDDLDAGHRTQEWLATADAADISPRTGGYWYHRATQDPHPAARDGNFQESVLARLAERSGVTLPA